MGEAADVPERHAEQPAIGRLPSEVSRARSGIAARAIFRDDPALFFPMPFELTALRAIHPSEWCSVENGFQHASPIAA